MNGVTLLLFGVVLAIEAHAAPWADAWHAAHPKKPSDCETLHWAMSATGVVDSGLKMTLGGELTAVPPGPKSRGGVPVPPWTWKCAAATISGTPPRGNP